MGLESFLLSKVSQTEKDKYSILSLICGVLKQMKNPPNPKAHIYREWINGWYAEGESWEKWVNFSFFFKYIVSIKKNTEKNKNKKSFLGPHCILKCLNLNQYFKKWKH